MSREAWHPLRDSRFHPLFPALTCRAFACRSVDFLARLQRLTYRSGTGTIGKLLWPSLLTALTAKITLSLEIGRVIFVA